MLLQIPDLLSMSELAHCRRVLEQAQWVDGRVTAGRQSALAKDNFQLPEDLPAARQLSDSILAALERSPLFMSAALPLKVFPPLFNRYESGQSFGNHVDNAIRQVTGTSHRVRSDLSATLFLNPPEEYDGGELVVEDTYGVHQVKLPAGHLILYPASSLHHVRPITRGARLASFFWIQSMVRDDGQRTLLFDLDNAIQRLSEETLSHPVDVQLTAVYHNLLRRWADA
jgi:PKHD-type hydroxylase